MLNKFYKFFKLNNGEDIIATTDTNCDNVKQHKTIFVYDPVLINTIRIAQGPYFVESYTMQPWIKLAKDDIVELPTESIVVAVDIDDRVVSQYEKFIDEYDSEDQQVNEVSEDQINEFFDDMESEEELDGIRNEAKKEGPTFH